MATPMTIEPSMTLQLLLLLLACSTLTTEACTTLLAGRKATLDGSTLLLQTDGARSAKPFHSATQP